MKKILTLFFISVFFISKSLLSQGILEGTVVEKYSHTPVAGVLVKISDLSSTTDDKGYYKIENISEGKQEINIVSVLYEDYTYNVIIKNKQTTNQEIELTLKTYRVDEIMVFGASKRLEKITETPSSVNVVYSSDLEIKSRNNQIGDIFRGSTGVDILRNGTSDFIVNARGFNNGLNRRVLVMQDGRDVAMPLLGAIEWNSFAYPVDDFSRVEFVRGPAAALYGANAFNGVLNMTSFSPKEVLGTRISILGGDYSTFRGDIRHAGMFGKFSYKINLGRFQSVNLSKRRDAPQYLEYPGLQVEARPISDDERNTYSTYGSLRLDYELKQDKIVTLEGGYANYANEAYAFGLGRTFVKNTDRPYIRAEYNSNNIYVHAHYMKRNTLDTMWLLAPKLNGKPGAPLLDNSDDIMLDAQYNFSADKKENLHFIFGLSQQFQNIKTSGTSIPFDVYANYTGVYSQATYKVNDRLKAVGTLRFDRTNIHESQLSPRIAFVYNPVEEHQFRISFGKSFQRPNYSELYRVTPDAPAFKNAPGPPVPAFININQIVADSIAKISGGSAPAIDMKLSGTRAYAIGNENLKVEKNLGLELGYNGIIKKNVYITFDVYYNYLSDFVTTFLPGVNKNFTPWKADLGAGLEQYNNLATNIVYNQLSARDKARLTTYNGLPSFVVSNTNIGNVQQYGFDVGINYYLTDELVVGANYSRYDFNVEKNPGDPDILPNSSPNKANLSLSYTKYNKFDASVSLQYSDKFDWLAGAFIGSVPTYTIVNFTGGVYIMKNLQIGVNLYNIFDLQHYEIFGGTFLPRYFTAKLNFTF